MVQQHKMFYTLDGINPVPWKAPTGQVSRKKGGHFVKFHSPPEMVAFKNAVAEAFGDKYPDVEPTDAEVCLHLLLWRKLEAGTGKGGKHTKHVADATNCQKALEDALQGVLYENDNKVRRITTEITQGTHCEPFIAIHVSPFETPTILYDDQLIPSSKPEAPKRPKVDRSNVVDLF